MELCLQAVPEAVEPFMQSMRRMEQCFGRWGWRTVITAHRRSPEEAFSFLMPARSHTLLTPQRVNNYGITQAVAKEAVARRPWYMEGKCMSVMIIVTRQTVLC